jgi:outer membrane cobalamin receptor
MNNKYLALALMTATLPAAAENVADNDSVGTQLQELVITHKQDNKRKLRSVATNTECLFAGELKRAACCNLGESFTTNPSVDVNYNDAATGAKQIKLLACLALTCKCSPKIFLTSEVRLPLMDWDTSPVRG